MKSVKEGNQNNGYQSSQKAYLSPCLSKYSNSTKESQKIEITSEMKEIIRKVRESSTKRLKKFKEVYHQRPKYNQQIEQIVKAIKIKKISELKLDSTEDEINRMVWMKRMEIQIKIANNQHKRKKILGLITNLKHLTDQKLILKQSPVKIKIQKQKLEQQLMHFKQLKQKKEQLQKNKLLLEENLLHLQNQSQLIKKKNQYIYEEKSLKINKIYEIHLIIQKLYQQLDQLNQMKYQLSKIPVPNQKQMIHCMFLVGILKQQTFIHSLLKKEKITEKGQPEETVKYAKIFEAFIQRKISINQSKSQIFHLNLITSIYMHCHSLLVNNMVLNMKTLPFFSEQFKAIYNYNQFDRYIRVLYEKLKMNKQSQRMRLEIQNQTKNLENCEKQLIISIDNHHATKLFEIMQILQIEGQYYFNVDNKKIKIRVKITQYNQQEKIRNDTDFQLHLLFDD